MARRAAAPGARSTPPVGSRLPAGEDPLRHEESGRGSPARGCPPPPRRARAHDVHLAFQGVKTRESREALDALLAECPTITFGKLPSAGSSGWAYLARSIRLGIDYLRFMDPVFEEREQLQRNVEPKMPEGLRRLVLRVARLGPRPARAFRRVLQLFERAILPPAHVERFVLEQAPDVFMASPLVAVGSVQADYLRAAKRLGIRTVYPVLSWDNLTTKGLVRDVPDLTLVWNEGMADEARSLHRIPTGRIRVVGSTAWDHWFDWAVRRSRDEFCHEVGLPADRPFVLYVGSSWWVVADEVDFVRRWVAALRGHGGLLADIGVLVRPHPQRDSSEWGTADLGGEALAPCGHASARSLSETVRGRTTSSRSTTPRPCSGSARARRSRRRSLGGRCTR